MHTYLFVEAKPRNLHRDKVQQIIHCSVSLPETLFKCVINNIAKHLNVLLPPYLQPDLFSLPLAFYQHMDRFQASTRLKWVIAIKKLPQC